MGLQDSLPRSAPSQPPQPSPLRLHSGLPSGAAEPGWVQDPPPHPLFDSVVNCSKAGCMVVCVCVCVCVVGGGGGLGGYFGVLLRLAIRPDLVQLPPPPPQPDQTALMMDNVPYGLNGSFTINVSQIKPLSCHSGGWGGVGWGARQRALGPLMGWPTGHAALRGRSAALHGRLAAWAPRMAGSAPPLPLPPPQLWMRRLPGSNTSGNAFQAGR